MNIQYQHYTTQMPDLMRLTEYYKTLEMEDFTQASIDNEADPIRKWIKNKTKFYRFEMVIKCHNAILKICPASVIAPTTFFYFENLCLTGSFFITRNPPCELFFVCDTKSNVPIFFKIVNSPNEEGYIMLLTDKIRTNQLEPYATNNPYKHDFHKKHKFKVNFALHKYNGRNGLTAISQERALAAFKEDPCHLNGEDDEAKKKKIKVIFNEILNYGNISLVTGLDLNQLFQSYKIRDTFIERFLKTLDPADFDLDQEFIIPPVHIYREIALTYQNYFEAHPNYEQEVKKLKII